MKSTRAGSNGQSRLLGLAFVLLLMGVATLGVAGCGGAEEADAPPSADEPPVVTTTEAKLSALTLSGATLSPAFSPEITQYRISVHAMSSIPLTVLPKAAVGTTVTVDGIPIESGNSSGPIPLLTATRPIDIGVLTADGKNTHYTLLAAVGQEGYVKASNTRPGQRFGGDVALSGDLLAVGAWGDASAATGVNGDAEDISAPNAGAVHVYSRSGGVWSYEAYIKASNARRDSYFGISVAIDGDTLVVGAQDESSGATGVGGNQASTSAPGAGAVYVFRRNCDSSITTWTQEAYLKASNTRAQAAFGTAVAIQRDTLVVGSRGESSATRGVNGNQADATAPSAGSAYVFKRTGTTWAQETYLKASNARTLAQFGSSVAIDGDTLVVGAIHEASRATGVNGNQNDAGAPGTGAAYVFARSGATWNQQAYLKASNNTTSSNLTGGFSISLAISGDTIAAGQYVEASSSAGAGGNQGDQSALNAGAVYLFTRTAGNWTQQTYLKPSNTRTLALFGYSLALQGDKLVVGSVKEASNASGIAGDETNVSAPNAGAAYVFTRTAGVWSQNAYLKASNTRADALFGYSVALSGDTAAIGARFETSNATYVGGNQSDTSAPLAGAVYVFR